MGTRNLTAVVLDGKYRIAQYGQWDGYPEGQGATVLEFLKGMDREKFEKALRGCHFYTKDELEELQKEYERDGEHAFWQKHYSMSRDRAAEILQIVQDSGTGIGLRDNLAFAGDSLMCEWAYIIDLDKNQLEVYRGYNKQPLADGQRFKDAEGLESSDGCHPIRMVKAYPLDALPTVDQMRKDASN